jgi:hypothetical protein
LTTAIRKYHGGSAVLACNPRAAAHLVIHNQLACPSDSEGIMLTCIRMLCFAGVVQMGHSSYGRGAPHICYMQVGNQGLFYSRAHQEQDQGQKQPSSWGQLAAHITHAAAGFVHGSSSRGTSLLASAAATGGAAAALPSDGASAPAKQPMGSTTSSSSSTGSGSIEVKPQWHALVLQALALAAVLLVGGLVLKHFFRSVVAALVACYSGLPFKA